MPGDFDAMEILRILITQEGSPAADEAMRVFERRYKYWAGSVFKNRFPHPESDAPGFRDWFFGWLAAKRKFRTIYRNLRKKVQEGECPSEQAVETALKNYLAQVIGQSAGPEFLAERRRTLPEDEEGGAAPDVPPAGNLVIDPSVLDIIRDAIAALRPRPRAIYVLNLYCVLREHPDKFGSIIADTCAYCASETRKLSSEIETELERMACDSERLYMDHVRGTARLGMVHIAALLGEEPGAAIHEAFRRADQSVHQRLAEKGFRP